MRRYLRLLKYRKQKCSCSCRFAGKVRWDVQNCCAISYKTNEMNYASSFSGSTGTIQVLILLGNTGHRDQGTLQQCKSGMDDTLRTCRARTYSAGRSCIHDWWKYTDTAPMQSVSQERGFPERIYAKSSVTVPVWVRAVKPTSHQKWIKQAMWAK